MSISQVRNLDSRSYCSEQAVKEDLLAISPGLTGAEKIGAALSELTNLQCLVLNLERNQLGPEPQASLEGAKGSVVPVPLSFGGSVLSWSLDTGAFPMLSWFQEPESSGSKHSQGDRLFGAPLICRL